ncbi:MAG: PP2C family protein-serine/threonine phosphatase [Cytophagales bacterium]|nr:PP2C family protein-serine/threonine phosphatase [Cytophagales bacterium]
MSVFSAENKFKLKELELNSLLEITQAINNNLPEELLYKIYDFTLRANLNIDKLALFVKDKAWACKVNFGTDCDFFDVSLESVPYDADHTSHLDIDSFSHAFAEFDRAIPVAHKKQLLAVVFLTGKPLEEQGEHVNTNFVQALSNIIIVAIENKKLARKQINQQLLNKELEIAANVQQLLLPKSLPDEEDLKVVAHYSPHHSVGGDYYDFFPLENDQFILCIADVSGKGIPAALLMSNFQASLQTIVRKTSCLKEIVEEVNWQLHKGGNESFITFFIAKYDKDSKVLSYVNSGHNPPVLFGENRKAELLEKGSTVLGFFQPLPFLNVGKVENLEEFKLFCYTDGLTECFNEDGEEFGQERLLGFLLDHWSEKLPDMHSKLQQRVEEHKGDDQYDDDVTMLSCAVGTSV